MTSGKQAEVSIALVIENVPGKTAVTDAIDRSRIEHLVRLILDSENVPWSHIGVIFSTHEFVRNLNNTWLGHDHDTDVLSFIIDETDSGLEGEVYVDVETALERYEEFNATLQSELERYVVHGVLHLAGHEDSAGRDKNQMHELEDFYLTQP